MATNAHACTPQCPAAHREHLNHMTDGRRHDDCRFCLRRREKGGTGLEGEPVNEMPAWPRDTTYIHVAPEHIVRSKRASLTECAAALAIADAIGPDVATVSVDIDLITAHEKHAPFRHWHAETPEEVAEWSAELDHGDRDVETTGAAALGLLDFELTWTEGNREAR